MQKRNREATCLGRLGGTGALATVAAHRLSEVIWRRVFNEDPPE